MSTLNEKHKFLDAEGRGLCSVPMFSSDCPAGFCDCEAYGTRPKSKVNRRWDGFEWRDDGLYAGYVPGLACPSHGGPKSRVFKDGNMFCAVFPNFENIQESPCGFGETIELARNELMRGENGKN